MSPVVTKRVARATSILAGSEKSPPPSFQNISMVKKLAVTRSRSPSPSRSAEAMELALTVASRSDLVKLPVPSLVRKERVELVSASLLAVTRSLSPSPSKSPKVMALGNLPTVMACSRRPNWRGASSHSSGMPLSLQSGLVLAVISMRSSTPLRLQSTARACRPPASMTVAISAVESSWNRARCVRLIWSIAGRFFMRSLPGNFRIYTDRQIVFELRRPPRSGTGYHSTSNPNTTTALTSESEAQPPAQTGRIGVPILPQKPLKRRLRIFSLWGDYSGRSSSRRLCPMKV